jgi:hypothetical protein
MHDMHRWIFDRLLEIRSLEEKGTQGLTLKYGLVESIAVKQSSRFHDVSVKVFSSSYRFVIMAVLQLHARQT